MASQPTKPSRAPDAGTIDFEPVSLAVARDASRDLLPGVERMFDAMPGGWEKFRQAQTREDKRLGKHAMAWLTALPAELRPLRCAVHYPHVVNRMAGAWNKPAELEVYFESLLNSRRHQRKGFPPEVSSEIDALRVHALA